MSEEKESSHTPGQFSVPSTSIDRLRLKFPSAVMLLPEPLVLSAGKILLSWATFEIWFDTLLRALLERSMAPDGWERMNFPKRRKLMAAEIDRQFSLHPQIQAQMVQVLRDSAAVQRSRNFIAHGRLEMTIRAAAPSQEEAPSQLGLRCSLKIKGKTVTEEMTFDDLEGIYYEIAHLAGRLTSAVSLAKAQGYALPDILPQPSSPDRGRRTPPTDSTP